jgi:hypothetical protein
MGLADFVKIGVRYFMMNDKGKLLIVRFTLAGVQKIDRTLLIKLDAESGFGPCRFATGIANWVRPVFANGPVIIRNGHERVHVSLRKECVQKSFLISTAE